MSSAGESQTLLLRMCGAMLHEMTALRNEVRELKAVMPEYQAALEGGADALKDEGSVSSLCVVEDADLRELLCTSFEAGELGVELCDVAQRIWAQGSGRAPAALTEVILSEIQSGAVRPVLLGCSSEAASSKSRPTVEDVVRRELQAMDSAGPTTCQRSCVELIILLPVFRAPGKALIEALVRPCAAARLSPPLALLCEATSNLLSRDSVVARPFDEVQFMMTPGATASCTLMSAPGGRIFISAPEMASGTVSSQAFPVYEPGDEDPKRFASTACFEELEAALQSVDTNLAQLLEVLQPSGDAGLLLGILTVLRTPGVAEATGLPKALCREMDGGAVLWAVECSRHRLASAAIVTARPPALARPSPSTKLVPPAKLLPAAPAASAPNSAAAAGASTGAVLSATATKAPAGNLALPPMTEHGPPGMPMGGIDAQGNSLNNQIAVAEEDANDDEAAEGAKGETSMLFAECFKDDLFHQRRISMSQVNNLYRMRKNGQTLAYREAGYDKLHDFIMDIPGLGLRGCGNKMEVCVVDLKLFEEFTNASANVMDESSFEKPAPVPEAFQNQVIETFRRLGVREIPVKNFRDVFNQFFPEEKLHSKIFGYRDIRGLIANVSVVDRVGGKSHARYVLKADISLEGDNKMLMHRPMEDGYRGNGPDSPMDLLSPPSPSSSSSLFQHQIWKGPGLKPQGLNQQIQQMDLPPPIVEHTSIRGARRDETSRGWQLDGDHHQNHQRGTRSQAQQPAWVQAGRPQFVSDDPSEGWSGDPRKAMPNWGVAQSATDFVSDDPSEGWRSPAVPNWGSTSAGVAPHVAVAGRPPGNWCGPAHSPKRPGALQGGARGETLQSEREDPMNLYSDLLDIPEVSMHPQFISRKEKSQSQAGQDPMLMLPRRDIPCSLARPPNPRDSSDGVGYENFEQEVPQAVAPARISPELGSVLRAAAHSGTVEEGVLEYVSQTKDPTKYVSRHSENSDKNSENSVTQPDPADNEDPGDLSGAQFYALRKKKKGQEFSKGRMFVSSPGAFSSEDRDASMQQGKFDMAALYQAQMCGDKYSMIVDFYIGRILFSNKMCDALFEPLTPLPQRELADLVYEADRLNLSSSVMYLNVGKFTRMDEQKIRLNTALGVRLANVSAEQLADTWWRVEFALLSDVIDEACEDDGGLPGVGPVVVSNHDFHFL